ncbi:MAG: hypothetical protein QNJ73_00190 [Gammaproteobacteria bacterium]|nr:hypothetical protein [Gammaproteobacteria bacterium]
MRIPSFAALLASGLLPAMAANADGAHPDLVLFRQAADSPVGTIQLLGDTPVRLLNEARDGRRVALAELPGGWARQLPAERAHTVEALVLEGELDWQGTGLGPYDYAHLPAAAESPLLVVGDAGARVLLFLDPPRDTDGSTAQLVDSARAPWQPATVAVRDMGRALALEIKDLRLVDATGQRTWLLRVDTDFEIPWEVHTSAEEGFLLDGDFRVGECLPDGPVLGEYAPGGYFYRPAGIAHSGPESGTESGAFWILRTPAHLTVEFLDDCD